MKYATLKFFSHLQQFRIDFHLLSFTNKISSTVLLTEASASRENNSLRSSVHELTEKLSTIDQSFTTLTNLLKTFVKSSTQPMTADAKHFLEEIRCHLPGESGMAFGLLGGLRRGESDSG